MKVSRPRGSHWRGPSRRLRMVTVTLALCGFLMASGSPAADPPGDGWIVYKDPHFDWIIRYPARILAGHFATDRRDRVVSDGIWVANFAARTSARHTDLLRLRTGFPPNGALFQIWVAYAGSAGPSSAPDTPLPVYLGELEPIRRYAGGTEPVPRYTIVTRRGSWFNVAVWLGPEVSSRDLHAIADVLASISFPRDFRGMSDEFPDPGET